MTIQTPNTPPADPRIVGFWEAIGGDYALINEYRPDGTLVQHVGERASKPAPFQIDGDYILTFLQQPDGSIFEQKTRYEISDDSLTFTHSPRKKTHFKRILAP